MTDTNNSILRYWALFLLTILGLFFIWYIRALFAPLVIAALIAYLLNPLVEFILRRSRLSRSAAIAIVFLVIFVAIIAIPSIIFPTLGSEIQTLSSVLKDSLTGLQSFIQKPVMILHWQVNLEELIPDPMNLLSEGASSLSANAFHFIGSTSEGFLWLLVILVTTYYLLKDYTRLHRWLLRQVSETHQPAVLRIYQEIKDVWSGYLQGNLTLMLIVGSAFTLAWLAIGLPGAIILGIITGLLTIIPDVGPAIAAGMAVLVALFEGSHYIPISNFWFALIVFGIYLILINIANIFLRARIYARSVKMHDGVIFVAIMAAIVLQGVLGALIVVPVLASAMIISRYIYRGFLGLPLWPEDDLGHDG